MGEGQTRNNRFLVLLGGLSPQLLWAPPVTAHDTSTPLWWSVRGMAYHFRGSWQADLPPWASALQQFRTVGVWLFFWKVKVSCSSSAWMPCGPGNRIFQPLQQPCCLLGTSCEVGDVVHECPHHWQHHILWGLKTYCRTLSTSHYHIHCLHKEKWRNGAPMVKPTSSGCHVVVYSFLVKCILNCP